MLAKNIDTVHLAHIAKYMISYHPRFYDLGRIITKDFIYLYPEDQFKQVFTPVPFVSFQSS